METNQPEWRITKLNTNDGIRWVIERLRLDAAKPYYLTERIYKFRVTAERELLGVMVEVIAKQDPKWNYKYVTKK